MKRQDFEAIKSDTVKMCESWAGHKLTPFEATNLEDSHSSHIASCKACGAGIEINFHPYKAPRITGTAATTACTKTAKLQRVK